MCNLQRDLKSHKIWTQCLLPQIQICFLICMHSKTSEFKQSVLTVVSPVSSVGIKDNNIIHITRTVSRKFSIGDFAFLREVFAFVRGAWHYKINQTSRFNLGGAGALFGGTKPTKGPRGNGTVYNPDNDLIWEYETDWTHYASSDICTFSPDVRMQTLLYKVYFINEQI